MKKINKLIKEQALTHFKKINTANINKKRILEILSNVDYTVDFEDIRYGNGYFIFSFPENSIAWFFMKEFPDWKFGIWLDYNNNEYYIFGEAITLIDKFKPSHSTLSFNNVSDFNKELVRVINAEGQWLEYNKYIEQSLKEEKLSLEYNKRNLEKINNYIKEVKNEYKIGKVDTFLKLIDRNTDEIQITPRYFIKEYTHDKKYFNHKDSIIRSKKIFIDLCNLLEYSAQYYEHNNKEFRLDIEEYIYRNICIENPQDYEDKAKLYKWKKNLNFEEYVQNKLV